MSAQARVLIVDDEPPFCKMVQDFLWEEDYELTTVECGEEALNAIDESANFDVVLLDLKLPDMNGFKVMEYLSEHAPDTLVVIMTGYATLENATEALRCGAYDYLCKPFIRGDLIKTLQNAMNHKQVREAHQQAKLALENSERCFRNLVENIFPGVLIVRDQKMLYQNATQKKLFGPITKAVISRDSKPLFPDDVEKLEEILEQFLAGEIDTAETDFRFYASPVPEDRNDLRWVLSRASHISYEGEDAVLINTVDITRLKELERLVIIKNKMHSLGRVAAGVAHEIRNPLTGVNSYLFSLRGMIESGIASEGEIESAKKMADQIQSASNQIEKVIKRVMDFAKPGVPQMALMDINKTLKDAVKLSGVVLRKQGIQLETNYEEPIAKCYADKNLVGQVVLNLINNAIQAMGSCDGTRRLDVSSSHSNGKIHVEVSDSGPGVSEPVRDKIFDPFFTTKDDGAGIGLNIAQRIMADHHGVIEVSQSRWGGACFRLELPVDRRTSSR